MKYLRLLYVLYLKLVLSSSVCLYVVSEYIAQQECFTAEQIHNFTETSFDMVFFKRNARRNNFWL